MISDVLFDAIEKIERYQNEMPEVYGGQETAYKIETVKGAMRALRIYLDIPPGGQYKPGASGQVGPRVGEG